MFSEVEVIHSVTVPVCLFYSALWTVGILCPRRLLVHPLSTASRDSLEYSTTEEDGFLYGLLVRITPIGC